MFQPVAPSGLAQPMITSSTSDGSSLARSSACLTTWPPIVAPCVRLSAPRQDLHSGVRAVDTITASVMDFLLERDEMPPLELQRRPMLHSLTHGPAGPARWQSPADAIRCKIAAH